MYRFPSHLVLHWPSHWELKTNTTSSQPSIHLRVSIESVVDPTPLLLIQHNLQHLASVLLRPGPLADNLNRVN